MITPLADLPDDSVAHNAARQTWGYRAAAYVDLADILPRLAINVGWLKLIGEARIEQKRRQSTKALTVSPEGKAHAARKASARKHATSKRRGYFGLARAIAAA